MKSGQRSGSAGGAHRESAARAAVYRLDDLEIDVGQRRVCRNQEEVPLSGHTFDFLLALIRIAPNIATPDYLSETVWGGRPVTPETIVQRAKLLRDALGDDPREPRYVAVARGHGYRLVPGVRCIARGKLASRSRLTVAVTAVLICAGALLYAAIKLPYEHTLEDGVPPAYREARAAMERHTPAGLNAAVEHFADTLAVHPDLIAAHVGLAEARMLQARYRTLDRQVALRLAEASLERALAIDSGFAPAHAARANLLVLRGDRVAAGQSFEHALALDPTLASALLDYGFMLLNDPIDHRPFESIDLWRRAARLDPQSDVLRSHLAWTEFRSGEIDRAESDLRSILERAPDFPVAHFVLAELLLSDGRQAEAIGHYRRTLALNTWFAPLAYEGLVEALLDLVRDEEAVDVLRQARSMPDDGGLATALELLLDMHRYPVLQEVDERAWQWVEELSALRPSQAVWWEAMLHRLQGRHETAREAMERGEPRLLEIPGGLPVDGYWRALFCPYAQLLTETGDAERGEAIARWLLNRIDQGPDFSRIKHIDPVVCLAALGEVDRALQVLGDAATSGLPSGWRMLAIRPELSVLHEHPGFAVLLDKIALRVEEQRQALAVDASQVR
jgi:tetratricopeptide (TPR) repeat protein